MCRHRLAWPPMLQSIEKADVVGGKCGATFVDRNLSELLTRRFGAHFTSLPLSKRGPGSKFMKDFEYIKNDFDGTNYQSTSIQLIMRTLEDDDSQYDLDHYEPDEGEIILTS